MVLMLSLSHAAAQSVCDTIGLPLSESFDDYGPAALPPCWYATRNYDSGLPPHIDASQHSSGTASLVLYPGTFAGSHYSMVIAPPLAADTIGDVRLHFRLMAASTAARLEVGICVDTLRQQRAFTPLDTLHVDQAMRWQDIALDLSRYTGLGRRLAFRMQRSLQSDAAACWIDDLRAEACGVSNLRIAHVGSTTMTLLFDTYGAGQVQVAYADTVVNDAASPLVVDGLLPLTQYTFTVGCPGGMLSTVSASTLEGASLVPAYWQPFTTGLPAAWHFPAGGTPSVAAKRLRLTPTGSDSCVAVLPLQESSPTNTLNLAFLLSSTGSTTLIVGVMDYADEPESFVPVDTIVCTATERRHLVSLAPYSGQGGYIAFMAKGRGTVSLGDVRVAHCMLDNLRLYNLTESEVTISWDTLVSGGPVQIEYGPQGFTPGSGTTLFPDTNPYVVSGLTPDTPYDIYVAPACGDSLCLRDRLQLTTFAHSMRPPYCTDFESSASLPQGWVGTAATISTNSYSGTNALRLAAGGRVSLPLLAPDTPDTVILEFYATGSGALSIGTTTDAYSTPQVQATLAPGGWQRHIVTLTAVASHCITLSATGTWTVDALTLHTATVVDATVGAIGHRSATLRWHTLGSDSIRLEYSPVTTESADFAEGSGTTVVAADSLSLDDLTPGTHYTVHLAPLTDAAGCYPLVLHFRTLADSVALPLCENFESLAIADFPDLWRRRSSMGEYPIVSTERNNTGSRSLHFAATATTYTTAILPDIAGCPTHYTLAFWTNITSNPQGAMLIVGTMTDIDDEATFHGNDTLMFNAVDQWRHHELTLVPGTGHLVLRLVGSGSGETHLFLDDLCIDACAARNVRLGSVQQESATLSWSGTGVAAVVAHISGSLSRTDTFYTSPAIITGLSQDQTYYISIEALCDCDLGGVAYAPGGTTSGTTDNKRVYFTLNTLPSATQLPICNTFENLSTGSYPYRWRRRGTVAVTDRNYYDGGHSLSIDSGSCVILPQVSAGGPVVLSFYAYSSDAALLADSALLVGVTTNPDSAEHMQPLAATHLDALGQWQPVAVLLGTAVDSGCFIVIRSAGALFADNLSAARHGIGLATVSADGLVQWQQWHSTSVAIEYGPAGFPVGSGTDTVVSAPPFVLPAVDPHQSYDIRLTPAASSTSCQSLCLTLGSTTAIPYCENFDLTPTGGMPQGWNIGRTHSGTPSVQASSGGNSLHMQGTSTARSMVVLPELAVDSLADLQLSVSLLSSNSQRSVLLVGEVSNASDPNTFVPHDTLQCSTSSQWQTMRVPLAGYSGHGRLALACQATAQTALLWIDSVSITRGITPSFTVVSARSVQVTSPQGAAAYIEYGPAGFAQGAGRLAHIVGSPFYIDSLAPDSLYWFYCRSDSAILTCLAPIAISMPTEVPLPYCYSRDTIEQLMLPEFSIDSLSHCHLYFDLCGTGSVALGVMEQRGDWSSFYAIDTVTGPSSAHVALSAYRGSGRFIAMRAAGGNFVIDNLRVTACELPTVTLEADGRVVVRGNGAVDYDGHRVSVSDSLCLTDLADTTNYSFHTLCDSLSAICGAPTLITTSMTVDLPYCVDLADTLPAGWTIVSGTPTVANGMLTLPPGTTVYLPIVASGSATLEYEELIGTTWQMVQTPIHGTMRPSLSATTAPRSLRDISIMRCALPPQLMLSQPGNGTVLLAWDSTYADFLIGYRIAGSDSLITIHADVPPLTLPVVPDTSYSLFLLCDSAASTCRPSLSFRTMATGVAVPYCQDIDNLYTALPTGWRTLVSESHTYFILPQPDVDSLRWLNVTLLARALGSGNATMVLGSMSDAANYLSFDSLASFTLSSEYSRCFHSLADYYGAGRFLALRVAHGSQADIARVVVGRCAAYGVSIIEHEADHVVLQWQSQGDPTLSVLYGPQGFAADSGTVATATVAPMRIDGLSPLTNYTFLVSYSCPAQDSLCPPVAVVDTFITFTPQGVSGCIDYTDLTATYVSCNSGSYTNPSQTLGVIDYGYLNAASRHTVHYDTTERDPRTGGLLRTVPEGESSSVRLGNWLAGGSDDPQAESLTYALHVDSGNIDLLLLRYAAVLQDAEHDPSLQPRFRLEILDVSGSLVDSCGMADFIANANLGWNHADDDVLWKDWTTVGLDLTPYAGQTIFVRLTTYDCGEGSHFGYAYFTLNCGVKRMETEGCSNVPSNRFTVPSGFNYSWTANQSDSVISTERSILVPSDNTVTYFCHLTSLDNPSCGFSMSAFAGARYPLALFDTALSVANCQLTLQLTDRSTISFDGVNPVGTGEPCEYTRWMLPGDTSTAATKTLVFTDTATVDITLIAGIASNQCVDTTTLNVHIAWPHPHATLDGDTVRCHDDDSTAVTLLHAATSDWSSTTRLFFPDADTTIGAIVVDTNGCADTLLHHLTVHPVFLIADTDSVCSSALAYAWRDTALAFTLADSSLASTLTRSTAHGCDSIMTLALHLFPSYDIHHLDTTCDNLPLPFFDTTLATTGIFLHTDTTQRGCDSLVTLHLTVHPTYRHIDPRQACDSLRWTDGRLYLADTVGATDSLLSAHRCDSLMVLALDIHPSHLIADTDSVCSSALAYAWRDTALAFTFADSSLAATLTRTTAHGCDSIMTLALHLFPSYDIHHLDTTCDNLPLPFFDTTLATTGIFLHTDTTQRGCDSLVTLHLTVHPTYRHIDPRQACDSLRWTDGRLYLADTVGAIDTLPTTAGCDSVLTLHLAVFPSFLAIERDTFCSGSGYLFRSHTLTTGGFFADTLSTVHLCDSVLAIDLAERPLPQVGIRVEHLCDEALYRLHAETDVPITLWHWGVGRIDTSTNSTIVANPSTTTEYILRVAYDDHPQCTASDSVSLSPFVSPQAMLRVSPQSLSPDDTHFDAYDTGQEYLYRRWFIDGTRLPVDDRHIDGYADPDADTLGITLVVGTAFCDDTAHAAIAIRHQALYVPTAFTPGAETNQTFFAVGKNLAHFEISIYTRTGALVFNATDINSPWDGSNLSGAPCPTGSYVYSIRYSTIYQPQAYQTLTGTVLLLR